MLNTGNTSHLKCPATSGTKTQPFPKIWCSSSAAFPVVSRKDQKYSMKCLKLCTASGTDLALIVYTKIKTCHKNLPDVTFWSEGMWGKVNGIPKDWSMSSGSTGWQCCVTGTLVTLQSFCCAPRQGPGPGKAAGTLPMGIYYQILHSTEESPRGAPISTGPVIFPCWAQNTEANPSCASPPTCHQC